MILTKKQFYDMYIKDKKARKKKKIKKQLQLEKALNGYEARAKINMTN